MSLRRGAGVLVVTHGKLADELVAAARVIVGEAPALAALSIGWNDSVDAAREQVRQKVAGLGHGDGAIVLTDLFGGTPTNLCLSFLHRDRVEIVTGVNLAMVLKAAALAPEVGSSLSLRELAERLAVKGRDSIIVASSMLDGERSD